VLFIISQASDAGHADHPQVLAAGEYFQGTLLEIRGADHFKVILCHQLGGWFVKRPTGDHGPPESGNPVAAVGAVVGIGQAGTDGSTAGVVMLEDNRRRFINQVLDDVEAVVNIGEIDFSRMFAHLQHIFHRDGAD